MKKLLLMTTLLFAAPFIIPAAWAGEDGGIYNYSCKVNGKTYPLRVDDGKNVLEWRGKKYSITVKEDCGRYGWHAVGNETSFDFCTATKGEAGIEDKDGNDQAQCHLSRKPPQ
jgi:hypothetical protein